MNEIFEVNNYEDQYLGQRLDRDRDDLLRQLGLLPARPEVGPAASPPRRTRWGSRRTSRPSREYSIDGGPFEPYNPALILGGLETGVTPLEMAYAYLTLQHNGELVSGTMADSPHAARSRSTRSASRPTRAGT